MLELELELKVKKLLFFNHYISIPIFKPIQNLSFSDVSELISGIEHKKNAMIDRATGKTNTIQILVET